MVHATKDDNLNSITDKILSGKDLDEKKSIYLMFTLTHPHYIKVLHMNLAMYYPDVYKEIRKAFFPNLLDKLKKNLGIR